PWSPTWRLTRRRLDRRSTGTGRRPRYACPGAVLLRARQRLQVFDERVLLLIRQPEAEERVVVVHDVQQGGETAIVVIASLVLGGHELASLAHEDAAQVHRLVYVVGGAVRLEAVDADVRGGVQ